MCCWRLSSLALCPPSPSLKLTLPLLPLPTPQTYAAAALVVIAVLNRLPIKLLPGQRGTGRRHSSSTSMQVR